MKILGITDTWVSFNHVCFAMQVSISIMVNYDSRDDSIGLHIKDVGLQNDSVSSIQTETRELYFPIAEEFIMLSTLII